MKQFVTSRTGVISIVAFMLGMAFVFYRVTRQPARHALAAAPAESGTKVSATVVPVPAAPPASSASVVTDSSPRPAQSVATDSATTSPLLAQNAAYLDRVYSLRGLERHDRDRQGNPITRRVTAGTPSEAGQATQIEPEPPPVLQRASLRLQGRGGPSGSRDRNGAAPVTESVVAPVRTAVTELGSTEAVRRSRPKRFNPYGNVVRCELVFTIDSTNEETPLIGVVMEPVYNNGELVIPAGAELHGVARPDRLRDRIFSGEEWVLVFPRDGTRPNGRQLNVRGVVLDRIEPNASGVTWGITDGSYGLEGTLIRTMQQEEIKRFAATFFSEAAQTLQSRDTRRRGQESVNNTPGNAVLQGLSANLEKIAENITAEIERHGVFIRVPAGHQFYFYPMQIIDPDTADISANVAIVK